MLKRLWRLSYSRLFLFSLFLILLPSFSASPQFPAAGFAQTLDFQKGRADALLEQGAIAHKNGDFNTAIELLQQALTIYQELKDTSGIGNTFKSLGNVYFSQGEYSLAVDLYSQCLEIFQLLDNRRGEAEVLASLSHAYLFLGEAQTAEEFAQQAEKVRREVTSSGREAAFFSSLSLDYETQGKPEQAIDLYQQQLAIARELGDRTLEANALTSLAQAYTSLGQYLQAIEIYQQQLESARKLSDRTLQLAYLSRIAQAYQALKQSDRAIEFYQQQLLIAREIRDRTLEMNALHEIANAYEELAQYSQVIEIRRQQLDIAKKLSDRLPEARVLNDLAATLIKAGNLTEAQAILMDALEASQRIITQPGSQTRTSPEETTYNLLQQVLVAQNQPEAALLISEQERHKTIKTSLNLTSLREPTLASLKQIAKLQKATIVEYSLISDREIYIWVIQPNGEIIFRQINLDSQNTVYPVTSISQLITQSREQLGLQPKGDTPTTSPQPLLELYLLLIKPIAEYLPESADSRVIFIPHKDLSLVPFSALVDVTGRYLIEKYPISTAPALQILGLTQQQRRKAGGTYVLAVGNSTRSGIDSTTEQEAIEVAKQNRVRPLVGEEATKHFLLPLLPNAKIVHFATSGGLENAIALFPSDKDNSLLAIADILNLQLKAELVVLSIRDSGTATPEGTHTLALSLIAAGVPSVITPIGSISDASTVYFISEFYQQLKRTGDKAQALRQSAIRTLQKYPNSHAWAAFTLVGEAR